MSLDKVGRAKAASTLKITHPGSGEVIQNDDGTDMTVTVYGEFSEEYKEAFFEQTEARIEKARESGTTSLPYKDLEAETFELVCRVTKDWNISTDDGPVELTLENARRIYKEYPWLQRQVRAHLEVSANFLEQPEGP